MSDLIERVARAIWHCGFHPDDVASGEADKRREEWSGDWRRAMDKAQAAIAAIEADRAELVAEIVAWLREEAKLCNCYARSSSECACGAWDDWKTVALPPLIDEIEAKWGKK